MGAPLNTPTAALLLALVLGLTACGGDGSSGGPPPAPAATIVSAPVNVQNCLDQRATPTGASVANLVVPDTIKVDLSQPAGFPNGRRLTDPVIDITLAYLFLDLTRHPVTALANVPINPPANDRAFRTEFPYLATPNGNPPGLTPGGANFNFRTDPPSAYVQVDRMGMPAVATAVISSTAKTAYNDDNPGIDGSRKYVNEISGTLTGLANALVDDFQRAGFAVCARPGP